MSPARLLLSAAFLLLSAPAYGAAPSRPDLSDEEILSEYGSNTNGPAQRAALDGWKKEIARSRSLRLEEAVPLLAKCISKVSYYIEFQVKERHAVLEEARAALNAIPDHAEHYARKINAERQQVLDGKLDWKTYNRNRGETFHLLASLKTVQAVQVHIRFLNDAKGHYADDFFPGQDSRCSNAGDAVANLEDLFDTPEELAFEPDIRRRAAWWKAWWKDVEAGKATFQFKDSPIEYNETGPVDPARKAAASKPQRPISRDKADAFLTTKGRTAPHLAAAAILTGEQTYYEELRTMRDDPVALAFLARRERDAAVRLAEIAPENSFADLMLLCHHPDAKSANHNWPAKDLIPAFRDPVLRAAAKQGYDSYGDAIELAAVDLAYSAYGDLPAAWKRAQFESVDAGFPYDDLWSTLLVTAISYEHDLAQRESQIETVVRFGRTIDQREGSTQMGLMAHRMLSRLRAVFLQGNLLALKTSDMARADAVIGNDPAFGLKKPDRRILMREALEVANPEDLAAMLAIYHSDGLRAAEREFIRRTQIADLLEAER